MKAHAAVCTLTITPVTTPLPRALLMTSTQPPRARQRGCHSVAADDVTACGGDAVCAGDSATCARDNSPLDAVLAEASRYAGAGADPTHGAPDVLIVSCAANDCETHVLVLEGQTAGLCRRRGAPPHWRNNCCYAI